MPAAGVRRPRPVRGVHRRRVRARRPPDPVERLARAVEQDALPFPLLSDADHAVAEEWGAWGEKKNYGRTYEGLIRSTVVLDPAGDVTWARYNVRAKGHMALLARELGLTAPAAS